jgi:hypothetical protein
MRWQTVLSGVIALALLEAVTSSTKAAGRVGDLFDGIASLVSHALSPSVAAIPDLRTKGGAATPTSDKSSGSTSKTMPADWDTSAKSLFV